jgi:deoxyribodipyrimidine photolyase
MIKKYLQFIKEADEVETPETETQEVAKPQSDNKYTELKEEVKSMIEKTIDKSGGDFESFKDKFVKSPEDTKIEGFINDSDIYEFYLKFRNDIDELLNNVKYFDEVPSESNTFGLYDYIISGTKRAVIEAVKTL